VYKTTTIKSKQHIIKTPKNKRHKLNVGSRTTFNLVCCRNTRRGL